MRKMELALAAFLAAAGALGDESVKFSGYVSSDIASSYVLYGARINKDPALQTYIELDADIAGFATMGASLWQNTDLTARRKATMGRMNECDFAAFARKSFGIGKNFSLNLEAGHIWYVYSLLHGEQARSVYKTMMEIYARAELANPWVTPYVFAAHDWQVTDGEFAIAGLKRDFPLADALVLTADFSAGGGDRRYLEALYPPWGAEKVNASLTYTQLSGKLTYSFGYGLAAHLQLGCTLIANRRIRRAIDTDGSDYSKFFCWAAGGIEYSF